MTVNFLLLTADSFFLYNHVTMIDVNAISTEAILAEILARCGLASEPPGLSSTWADLQRRNHLTLARHLTGAAYQNLFVAVQGGALQIFTWLMLICELRGTLPEAQLIEKIELSALPERAPADPAQCICLDRPLPFNHYEKLKFIGRDETHGRFGEVTWQRCRHCQRHWLHYFVEYEAYRESGRYFMGLITPAVAEALAPEAAVDYLAGLDWHLYGGSYFGRAGKSTDPHIDVDG